MKRLLSIALLVCLLSVAVAKAGEPFPDLVLEGKLSPAHATYLGFNSNEHKLSNIRSKYILIEVMSMYCPICQREAPLVNEVFQYLDARYSGRIKMIAIGAGNSQFEMDFFRKKYGVAMPMFTDQNYTVHKAVGGVGTPWYALVEQLDDGNLESVLTHEGAIENKDEFIRTILEKAGYRN